MATTKGKKTSTQRPAGSVHAQGPAHPDDERQRMIAEAAYFRALSRGFTGGDPMQDWIVAEREISRLLPGPRQQKEEQAAYKKLRGDVRALLADVGTVTTGTAHDAINKARSALTQAGEYTADTVDKVAATLEKEIAEAAIGLAMRGQLLGSKAADVFGAWRDRGQVFLGEAATALGEWVKQAGARLERPVYKTGEVVAGGTFECAGCGERMQLETDAHLPMCARCRGTSFRRITR